MPSSSPWLIVGCAPRRPPPGNMGTEKGKASQGSLVETCANGPKRSACASDVTADPAGRTHVNRRHRECGAQGIVMTRYMTLDKSEDVLESKR